MAWGDRQTPHLKWCDRPWLAEAIWFCVGAVFLSTLSIFQKQMLGADPFVLKGYIVPVFFGGGSVLLIGLFLRRSRRQLMKRLQAEMEDAEHAREYGADQEILAHIVNLALAPLTLNEMLQGALEKMLTREGLNLNPKGCIFLADQKTHNLSMVAEVGLPDPLLSSCALVKPGQCLCGRVARDQQVVFADGLDHRHETTYDGIQPHGHYCAPIESDGDLLGVLNLYVPEGHVRTGKEDLFINTIAATLATAICRKQAERELHRAKIDLEYRVEERTQDLKHEIEERIDAEAKLKKLSSAVDQSSAMVFITDREGVIEYINPMFTELTGYSAKEAIGENPRLLKSNETPPELYTAMWQTILAGDVWRGELKDLHKDGHTFWVSSSISPIKDDDGRVTHFVAMHENITARKEAQAEIEAARESAEIANRAKAELLANTSHELRTPLNAIIGFSASLKEEIFGTLSNDKQREYVDDIHSSGTHLLALINDILDVSAIEAGKLELHEDAFDVAAVIDVAQKMVLPRALSGDVRLSTHVADGLPDLFADERRIKQVVLNLLSNAIKFTPAGGEVTLHADLNDSHELCLQVTDTGIGMSKHDLAKAMTQFGQVDGSLARKHEGTGLGLPLSVGLVEAHGGILAMSSEKGVGTTATITFPAHRSVTPE